MNDGKRTSIRSVTVLLGLAVVACALFGAVASFVIAAAVAAGAIDQPPPLMTWMVVKGVLFTVAAAAGVFGVRRLAAVDATVPSPHTPCWRPLHSALLIVLTVVAAVLVFPRLDIYPFPEPDELHHLIVARNVAEYGEYASGQPREGFIRFDPYDSVGAPVILPVAASIGIGGSTLAAGRVPVAVSFLILIPLAVALFAPVLGAEAALLGGVFLLCGWGSVYLARTVYGEVPALAYFTAGLLLWRKSLGTRPWFWSPFAGLLIGLATLAKSILLLSAFPFAAVVLADRFAKKRLGAPQLIVPIAGVVLLQGLWLAVSAGGGGTEGSTIGLYQHYLMFGFGGLIAASHWIAVNQGLFLAAGLVGTLLVAPRLVERWDPAAVVALLTAILYGFWWVFFTDAHIPRYLWFTIALFSFPFGYLMWHLASQSLRRPGWAARIVPAVLIVVLCLPYAPLMRFELDRIYGPVVVGKDERNLIAHVKRFREGVRLATTWWPLERWTNFFLNRPMPVVDDVYTSLETYDVVVSRGYSDADLRDPHITARKFGDYVIYWEEP